MLIASFCRFADELAASLEESATISWGSQNSQKGVFTQWQALEYIGGKIKPTKFARRIQYNKADEAREKLATVVVSHVPVIRYVLSQYLYTSVISLCVCAMSVYLRRCDITQQMPCDEGNRKGRNLPLFSVLWRNSFGCRGAIAA